MKPHCGATTLAGKRCELQPKYEDGRCYWHTVNPDVAEKRRERRAGRFKPGDERTVEAARKGGRRKAAKAAGWHPPYEGTAIDLMDEARLTGASFTGARAIVKAADALPMTDEELAFYQRHTEREEPPSEPVSEVVLVCGRRSGKTRLMGVKGFHAGIAFDTRRLAPGELGVVMLIAADRKQARQLHGYMRGLAEMDAFKPYVHRILKESIELANGVVIEVHTCSYKSTRGLTCIALLADEVAFWWTDDAAANPDSEVLNAIRPSMATIEGAQLFIGSNPYAAQGEMYRMHEKYFGKDHPNVLVVNADTKSMNPTVPDRVIDDAFEADPVAAASEYGSDGRVVFRTDVSAFLDPSAVRAVTVEDRREIAPQPKVKYHGFVDPSGGSRDSYTLAVAHAERGKAVLDCVREVRPPFSPDGVTAEFAVTLKSYGLSKVTGDKYALQWVTERFSRHGITMEHSELTKSDIYGELLPLINAQTAELLDVPVLHRQLVALERRTSRAGKDSIDHPRNGRDDVANAAAGALALAAPQAQTGKQFHFGGPPLDSARGLRGRHQPTGPATVVATVR